MSDWEIVRTMAKYGGSFARAIAEAADKADPDNLARLKTAFPELWVEYADLARLAKRRAAADQNPTEAA